VLREFTRGWKVRLGLAIFLLFLLAAAVGPWFVEHVAHLDPRGVDYQHLGSAPSAAHVLGTTTNGEDVLAQLIVGARGSVLIGLITALVATGMAVVVGVTGAFLGGVSDHVSTLLTNLLLTLPGLPLILVIAGYLHGGGIVAIGLLLGFLGWAGSARNLRAQTLSLRSRDFVTAMRMLGEGRLRLMCFEVLPHLLSLLAALFLYGIVGGILGEASLAFLGIGSGNQLTWGVMISEAQNQNGLLRGMWWWFVSPGLCIALISTGVAFINFGVDEVTNPRLRSARYKAVRRFRRTTMDRAPEPVTGPQRLLDVNHLTVEYLAERGSVVACNDLSFTLDRGEILGVAGESGSGKSTLITALTRLQRPPAVTSNGQIMLHSRVDESPVDLATLSERELRKLRWKGIAIVLQNAMDALNPVMRLGAQFADVLRAHDRSLTQQQVTQRTMELLTMVGISGDRARSYPHELSGGMRQRAMIALALACNPQLVVMDEPTTAVDVVMQRQILSQILELRERLGFAVVFVTHDLSLLLELADRIAIMYAGRIVEIGTSRDLYFAPKHPYTMALRDSFPPLRQPINRLDGIPGSPPDLRRPPGGCPFHPRCTRASEECATELPALRRVDDQDVACLLYGRPTGVPAPAGVAQ
jgi:oligopeptide/dipeptide ABC transporter ATP-binding protein